MSGSSELLNAVKARIGGSWAAIASTLGVSAQHVGQVRHGRMGLSATVVARAAMLAGEDPLRELRRCGHEELVDAIAAGVGAWEALAPEEQELVMRLRRSAPAVRQAFNALLSALEDDQRGGSKRVSRRRGSRKG